MQQARHSINSRRQEVFHYIGHFKYVQDMFCLATKMCMRNRTKVGLDHRKPPTIAIMRVQSIKPRTRSKTSIILIYEVLMDRKFIALKPWVSIQREYMTYYLPNCPEARGETGSFLFALEVRPRRISQRPKLMH
jgi:hypothetical protein